MLDLKRDKRFRYILIFKNEGESAGATLEHTHSQLIALPIVPKLPAEEVAGSKTYFNYKERCVYCDIIRQEKDEGTRIIEENPDFIAVLLLSRPDFLLKHGFCPRITAPFLKTRKRGNTSISRGLLKIVLMKVDRALDVPPYNMIIHSSPFFESTQDYYHWHIELIPTLTKVAGFEWGTGFYINPTPPEEAARFLREAPTK